MIIADFPEYGIVFVEVLLFLIVVTNCNFRAFADGSRVLRQETADNLEHRRLAGPVFPEKSNALAFFDQKTDIVKERFSGERFRKTGHGQHVLAAFNMRHETDPHALFFGKRLFDAFHLLEHLLAAFGTFDCFLAAEGTKLGNDLFLMPDLTLLVYVAAAFRLADLRLLFIELIIISEISHGTVVLDFHDAVHNAV